MSETMNTKTVIDISLDIQTKRQFRINGDDNLIISLNPGDMGIIHRYEVAVTKMEKLLDRISNLEYSEEPDINDPAIQEFKEIDAEARTIVDELFDCEVCKICADGGSMFDMCNGKFRFEEIIRQLFTLYDKTISDEQKKVEKRMRKHTDKYIPQDHKKK